jgi:ABC-type sugar transport system ATPase subunit
LSGRSALAEGLHGANPIEPPTYLVELKGITKAFGSTLAAADIDFPVAAADVVGLVGGNGAGKSTLMRILCGITAPTLGRLSFDGVEESFTNYDAGAAQRRGIRMVHQELSLCATLTVAENFFVEDSQHASARPGWRNAYRSTAQVALDAVSRATRSTSTRASIACRSASDRWLKSPALPRPPTCA